MALVERYTGPDADCCNSSFQEPPLVRPHHEEEGVFVFERNDTSSIIRQGIVEIGGAAVRYTYERPEETVDATPLIITPGYGGIKPAYRDLRNALAAHGKPAVTFRPPRSQSIAASLHPKHVLHPDRLLAQATYAIARDLIERYGLIDDFEQVDAAGHSMGGPAVVSASLHQPERFRSIIAMASAGLDGHTLADMARRAPGVLKDELIPVIGDIRTRNDLRSIRDIAHYVGRNPLRTVSEGLTVGSGDIRPKVAKLGNLSVRTAALQFPSDRFFPSDGVRERSAGLFDHFREFPDSRANHVWPQLAPEAVAHELVDIIQFLGSIADTEVVSIRRGNSTASPDQAS